MCKKIILVTMTILIAVNIFTFNCKSYASNSKDTSISDIFQGARDFMSKGGDVTKDQEDKLITTSNLVYNILLVMGIAIAVIVSGILGIKFMIGSVEEKAQIKDQLVPFVIGCIVVFGAFGIWKIVVSLARQL